MRKTGWSNRASYAHFLQVQRAARLSLEIWAERSCPSEICPPRQSHLIERDLWALGVPPSARVEPFDVPEGANPIGFAWAIAGSSLGNRAILRDIERHGDTAMPTAFLADPGMTAFWTSLRPALEAPATDLEAAAAARAAACVFDHFRKAAAAFAPAEAAA